LENVYIFPEKTVDSTWEDVIDEQLNRLSLILRQYCDPLLKGDFEMKEEIRKIEKQRTDEMLEKFHQMAKQPKKNS
jgi:hypothetical protein